MTDKIGPNINDTINVSQSLLILAYAFPPENISGADRPYRFYRYLKNYGIVPIVITASPQSFEKPDIAFVRDELRDFPRKNLAWHVERVLRKLFLPGELGLTWSLRAAKKANKIKNLSLKTIVFSTSPPISSHLAALQIKNKLKIPWIADFRDPIIKSGGAFSWINIYPRIEKYVMKHADAVIANTDSFSEILKHKYPIASKKIYTIWNGFDPAVEIFSAPVSNKGYKKLVHIGALYGGRNPTIILESILRLFKSNSILKGMFKLSLIGPKDDDVKLNQNTLNQLTNAGVVEYFPSQIPKQKALLINRHADALLLIQPQSDTQVPAKLFEYIRIGRPVLAFLKKNSPSERILARSGISHKCIYPEDPEKEIDLKILEFLSISNKPNISSKWFNENFNAINQTKQLVSIVESL
jgi:glycosyltransferase involved in cell wall biosynthesis